MVRKCRPLLSLLVGALAALPIDAQTSAHKSAWVIDYGESRCTLLREVDAASRLTFGIRIIPGNSNTQLFVIDPTWDRHPLPTQQTVQLVLAPSGTRLEGRATTTKLKGASNRILLVDNLGDEFLDSFIQVTTISVHNGKRQLAEIPLSGAGKAVKALRECNDALLTSWGANPRDLDTLQKKPVGDIRRIFKPEDYPRPSLMEGSSGEVVVAYTIGELGTIDHCKVVGPSGDPLLDRRTCEVILQRGRFEPAVYRDGKPTRLTQVSTIIWLTSARPAIIRRRNS